MTPVSAAFRALIRAYQILVSPVLAPACRYHPTCSEYALDAVARFGALGGVWLALRRIARCHPWGGWGFDPIPDGGHPAADGGALAPTERSTHSG